MVLGQGHVKMFLVENWHTAGAPSGMVIDNTESCPSFSLPQKCLSVPEFKLHMEW